MEIVSTYLSLEGGGRGAVVQREVLTSAIDSRMGEGVVLMRIEGRSPFQFGRKLPSFAGASVPS